MEIRRTETNSVNSINLDNNINAEIIHTSRPMPFDSTTATINSYEVFMNEYGSCDKYRLLLKVNPFCTNILFNQCTEIVMNEGGGNEDDTHTVLDSNTVSCEDAYGKTSHITRVDMINNTEYSREAIGYTYHPGYDLFDNHILRNKGYNTVNYIRSNDVNRNLFNTISDYSRYNDGSPVLIAPRRLTTDANNPFTADVRLKKHIYKVDDLYSFFELDSVNENLREENGWYGFKNTNAIESMIPPIGGENEKPMDINRVINSRDNCDFIDMYPDRTLFSFTPKFNPYRRREENNWDVILTYPYRNSYSHNIVSNYRDEDGNIVDPEYRVNGLLVASCQNVMGDNGSNVTLFRTFSKHGLNDRDSVMFSYLDIDGNNSSEPVYKTLPNTYWVTRIGDINHNNKENFFYLSDYNFLNDLFNGRILETFYHSLDSYAGEIDPEHIYGSEPNTIPSDDDGVILVHTYEVGGGGGLELPEVPVNADEYSDDYITVNGVNYMLTHTYYEAGDGENPPSVILRDILSRMKFRVSRVYKGKKSDYYIRIFRKLPNWKYSREVLTENIAEHKNLMGEFTRRNACDEDGHNILFNYSASPMAFSNTIYNDAVTQYLFTDSIQTEHIKDNRGRPLSSFYVTVLKSNRGYREWYGLDGIERNITSDSVEYSHCFGKVISGFNYLALSGDSRLWAERNYLSDVGILTDKDILDESLYGIPTSANEWVGLPAEITLDNDEFVGDICEWNDYECIERVLEKVCYRFNTAQREYGSELLEDFNFTDHEITSDDYDLGGDGYNWNGFNVTVYDRFSPNFQNMLTKVEGYFYNPHYEIPIKKFGNTISQGSHELLSIKKATPIQADGIFIRLETYGKHKLTLDDSVYLCNDNSHLWYLNDVVYIDNPNSFVINIIPRDIEEIEGKPYVDWITTCDNINRGVWKVRVRNKSIPQYASNIGVNTFLWRDTILNTSSDSFDYPFANGHNYIEHTINFFLKRQDPYGYNGLYNVLDPQYRYPANDTFPDVAGTKPLQETIESDNYIIPDGLC